MFLEPNGVGTRQRRRAREPGARAPAVRAGLLQSLLPPPPTALHSGRRCPTPTPTPPGRCANPVSHVPLPPRSTILAAAPAPCSTRPAAGYAPPRQRSPPGRMIIRHRTTCPRNKIAAAHVWPQGTRPRARAREWMIIHHQPPRRSYLPASSLPRIRPNSALAVELRRQAPAPPAGKTHCHPPAHPGRWAVGPRAGNLFALRRRAGDHSAGGPPPPLGARAF